MCFSAVSSFTGGGLISIAAIATLRQTHSPRLYGLACVPVIFAAHQLIEGTVWLTLDDPVSLAHRLSVATFGLIAFGVWPALLPFFLGLAERKPGRRRILFAIALAELYLVAYVASQLPDMVVAVREHSLAYSIAWEPIHYVLYAAAMMSLFISTLPRMRIAALILLGSFLTAFAIKREAGASVWCFFAAALSVSSVGYIRVLERAVGNSRVAKPSSFG